jgi:hypothetical protein
MHIRSGAIIRILKVHKFEVFPMQILLYKPLIESSDQRVIHITNQESCKSFEIFMSKPK